MSGTIVLQPPWYRRRPFPPQRIRRLGASLLLVLVGCAVATIAAPVATLAVTNEGPLQVTVYLDGQRIGVAMPGQVACLSLRWLDSSPQHVLSFRQTAGGITIGPAEDLSHSAGWSVYLGHSLRWDVLTLQPAPVCR